MAIVHKVNDEHQYFVQVDLCNQLVDIALSPHELKSMSTLKMAILLQTGVKEVDLVFHDKTGKVITSDDELRMTVANGNLPIRASLCDSNIHALETKRDELAQMQWRMVRQQFASLHDDIYSHSVRLKEVKEDLSVHKAATSTFSETIRQEVMKALSEEMAQQREYTATLANRVCFVEQALHQEETAREMVSDRQNVHFNSIKTLLDADREQRMQDLARVEESAEHLAQDMRKVEGEWQNFVIKCKSDEVVVQGRYDDLSRTLHDEIQHRNVVSRQSFADFAASKQALEEKVLKLENKIFASSGDLTNRIRELDARCHQSYQQFVQTIEERDIANVELSKQFSIYCEDLQELKGEVNSTRLLSSSNLEKVEALAQQIIDIEDKTKIVIQEDCSKFQEQYLDMGNRVTLLNQQVQSLGKVMTQMGLCLDKVVTETSPQQGQMGKVVTETTSQQGAPYYHTGNARRILENQDDADKQGQILIQPHRSGQTLTSASQVTPPSTSRDLPTSHRSRTISPGLQNRSLKGDVAFSATTSPRLQNRSLTSDVAFSVTTSPRLQTRAGTATPRAGTATPHAGTATPRAGTGINRQLSGVQIFEPRQPIQTPPAPCRQAIQTPPAAWRYKAGGSEVLVSSTFSLATSASPSTTAMASVKSCTRQANSGALVQPRVKEPSQ